MEPWEALDVDDSDLPSLLRPCKNRRPPTASQSGINLKPSSQVSSNSKAPCRSSHSPPLVSPRSEQSPHFSPEFNTSRLIPGPAGALQAAMNRRNRNILCNMDEEYRSIPTQDYVRAVEDAEDDDFKRNPWLCAAKFVGVSTSLSDIKKCVNIDKVDLVVAVIKACTPNSLGDLMVTLKDPTGTIDASIHRKVLTEGEHAKDISIGSVLILQKVAWFAPTKPAHYLNITVSNVVKVICNDSGPPSKQEFSAPAVKYASPNSDCTGEPGIYLPGGRTEGIMAAEGTFGGNNGQMEKGNSFTMNGNCSNEAAEPLVVDIPDDDKWPREDHLSNSVQGAAAASNLDDSCSSGQESHKQRPPLVSRSALPQWTDEQLNELFAVDFESDF